MRILLITLMVAMIIGCAIKVGPPTDVSVEATPERIQRGEYLVEALAGCVDCHSERNWDYYSAPIKLDTRGAGGEQWSEEVGFPGTITASNITPHALESWTDGEIIRAFTAGVSKDGTPLFPIMPYHNYAHMAREDVYSVVAYLRTLEPIDRDIPERKLNFPLGLIVRTMPEEHEMPQHVPVNDPGEYSKYVATLAGCHDCHTPTDKKGQPVEGMAYAGGAEFGMPDGNRIVMPNITSHETGIGSWTREQFIARFKAFASDEARMMPLAEGQKNTYMPWTYYAGMSEYDLGAIYDYLRSIPAVDNETVTYPEG